MEFRRETGENRLAEPDRCDYLVRGRPRPDRGQRGLGIVPRNRFRILALDIDGTVLDSGGALRPRTIEAVSRAVAAGITPVLCTGRRYRRAVPVARQLGIDSPLVCNSGALVKETEGHRTLWRADLGRDVLDEVFALFEGLDELAVSFTDRPPDEGDFLVARSPAGRPLFDDYVDQNRAHAEVDPDWTTRPGLVHYHLCAIGDRPAMEAFEREILARVPGQVQTFVQRSPRYAGTMCEVLRHDASKWSALLHLAELWGVEPEEICAVGDDMNDLPMLRGAGLGVAMGHADVRILEAADHVTGSDDEDGVAMLIDDLLLA
jgi:5-amino-6-(5-phospho-D-ribitylamino)uracil phosphatase